MSSSVNPHLTDATVKPFLDPNFTPIDYLNAHLPSYSSQTQIKSTSQATTIPPPSLSAIASQTQSHIASLSAQQSRLSTTLTDLTDDILRTSSRLAYEVELLRGEAVTLAEMLTSNGHLNDAIKVFVPDGLLLLEPETMDTPADSIPIPTIANPSPSEPASLPQLRTLLKVRMQLTSVIQTFNLALSFPMPPSLLISTAASLISVQAPNDATNDPQAEQKAQTTLNNIKTEVRELIKAGDINAARERVDGLKKVSELWKGTAEEKPRRKWIEELEGPVKEAETKMRMEEGNVKIKIGGSDTGSNTTGAAVATTTTTTTGRGGTSTPNTTGGGGFLRRLRDEIYLD